MKWSEMLHLSTATFSMGLVEMIFYSDRVLLSKYINKKN